MAFYITPRPANAGKSVASRDVRGAANRAHQVLRGRTIRAIEAQFQEDLRVLEDAESATAGWLGQLARELS